MYQFTRTHTDSVDQATEVLTIVTGGQFYCSLLGRETPYLVQITSGPDLGDFVGLYDLDGEEVPLGNASWDIASDVPADVVAVLADGWDMGGSCLVEPVVVMSLSFPVPTRAQRREEYAALGVTGAAAEALLSETAQERHMGGSCTVEQICPTPDEEDALAAVRGLRT